MEHINDLPLNALVLNPDYKRSFLQQLISSQQLNRHRGMALFCWVYRQICWSWARCEMVACEFFLLPGDQPEMSNLLKNNQKNNQSHNEIVMIWEKKCDELQLLHCEEPPLRIVKATAWGRQESFLLINTATWNHFCSGEQEFCSNM